jgi:OmcA/MtrC family decaheme c-type cytochrome
VVCHTSQRANGRTASTPTNGAFTDSSQYIYNGLSQLELVTYVHKIHMGEELKLTGYSVGGVKLNEVRYPQDIRNCTKCHSKSTATPQGDNWKDKPSRKACGSCHDGVSFAANDGIVKHLGGAKADDSQCGICHTSADVEANHITPYATPNNPSVPTGLSQFTYEISSVTVAGNKASIKFRIKKDGTAVTLNTFAAGAVPLTGFTGGPSIYALAAMPQDGINAPADFNVSISSSLQQVWDGTKGTLSARDTDGYYTATLGNATYPNMIPANAVLVTGALIGTFSQTNAEALVGDLNGDGDTADAYSMPVLTVYKAATNYTGRRGPIVNNDKCNACHDMLGTKPNFHGSARNDGNICAFCHNPNRTSSGWSANASTFIHGIHGAAKRGADNPFVWHSVSATVNYSQVGYPGILNNCEQCHNAGYYDFSASAYNGTSYNAGSSTAVTGAPKLSNRLLYSTVATGTLVSTSTSSYSFAPSSLVARDVAYGSGYSYNSTTGAVTAAAGTTLVTSPITAACFSCHAGSDAQNHMKANGGSIYAVRTAGLATAEQCLVCHGAGKVAAIKDMHRKTTTVGGRW